MTRRKQKSLLPASKPPRVLKKFMLFPKLPTELRDKIWGMALQEGRVIEILYEEFEYDDRYFTETSSPVLLRTCVESRIKALKFYELVSFPNVPFLFHIFSFYINFNSDTMLFSRSCISRDMGRDEEDSYEVQDRLCDFLWRLGTEMMQKVQNVAFTSDSRGPASLQSMGICQCHTHLCGLKKIVFVYGDHCCSKTLRHQSKHSKAVGLDLAPNQQWQSTYNLVHDENSHSFRGVITRHNQGHVAHDGADPETLLDPNKVEIVPGRVIREA